jgi:hypothetical protein
MDFKSVRLGIGVSRARPDGAAMHGRARTADRVVG